MSLCRCCRLQCPEGLPELRGKTEEAAGSVGRLVECLVVRSGVVAPVERPTVGFRLLKPKARPEMLHEGLQSMLGCSEVTDAVVAVVVGVVAGVVVAVDAVGGGVVVVDAAAVVVAVVDGPKSMRHSSDHAAAGLHFWQLEPPEVG